MASVDAARARGASADQVRLDQVRYLLSSSVKNSAFGYAAVVLSVIGSTYLGEARWPQPGVILWATGVSLCLATMIALAIEAKRRQADDAAVRAFARFMLPAYVVSGACWGSCTWLFLPAQTTAQMQFVVLTGTMVIAAGSSSLATFGPAVRAYAIAYALVFCAGLLRLADPALVVVAIAYCLFTAVLLVAALDQEQVAIRTIRLSLENRVLLERRTEQHRIALAAQAEAQQQRHRAEEADRGKTHFLASASHDLRQPLHALLQYVDQLKRTPLDLRQTALARRLDESVNALVHLLDAMLDFSRVSVGALVPEWRHVEIGEVLARLDTQMSPVAEAAGVVLTIEPGDGRVWTDPALLERVLRNLIDNAIRSAPRGKVRVRANARGAIVRLLVADDGIGIASSDQPRLFDAYFQVDNPARDPRKGLGLGLSIVRHLGELLGLRLRLRTRLARGTTFAVDIPTTGPSPSGRYGGAAGGEAISESLGTPDDSAERVRGASVLLVDNDPLALDALAATLRGFGCRVTPAPSMLDALDALVSVESTPQVLVTDLRLGGSGSGLALVTAARERHRMLVGPAFDLRAIVITGDTATADVHQVHEAGIRLLFKPVTPAAMRDALAAELAQLSGSRPAA